MSEERLSSSNKLDIEGAQRLSGGDETLKESYKQISEDIGLSHVSGDTVKNSNMVKENGDHVLDGADEKMLSDDKKTLALKNVEVKFISSDPNQNGDAKIDIGAVEKTFTGMTKEELMKYANDPFWVRLRWVLFILFWALWIAMLVGAVAIIVYAPKCTAPAPLVWWKKGPLITIDGSEDEAKIQEFKDFKAQGVVYELSGDETYFVDTPLVRNKIKKLVDEYKTKDIHLVLDLTANYVTTKDPLFTKAVAGDPDALSAFVTHDRDNGWKKVGGRDSAWKQEGKTFFLSQFADNVDLQMASLVAQNKLIGVLNDLAELGVRGFRLNNAKHFIISSDLSSESPNFNHRSGGLDEYEFYTHGKSVYQPALGDVLHNFSRAVHNATDGEGFLTISDDSATRAEVFVTHNAKLFGFDLPRFVFLNKFLQSSNAAEVPKLLYTAFKNLETTVEMMNLWMQVSYNPSNFNHGLDGSAYNMFMSLLPGVQIVPIDALNYDKNKTALTKKLEEAREETVFQHGSFDYLLSENATAFAYTRIKSGTPGMFVALNPTDADIKANFTSDIIGSELSVLMLSDAFKDNPLRGKVSSASVPLPKYSVAIFTFVPK